MPPDGSSPRPVDPGGELHVAARLEGLRRLAYNLYWTWHPRTRGLFDRIDSTGWARYRSPIPVISGTVDWPRLLDDAKFLAEYHDVLAEFDALHGATARTTGSSASTPSG